MRFRRTIAIVTLLAILMIAGFGLITMAHGDSHIVGCFATTTTQVMCPIGSPFTSIAFHVDGWQQVLSAVLALTFALAVLWRIWAYRLQSAEVPARAPPGDIAARIFSARASPVRPPERRWLVLRTRRDPTVHP